MRLVFLCQGCRQAVFLQALIALHTHHGCLRLLIRGGRIMCRTAGTIFFLQPLCRVLWGNAHLADKITE